MFSPWKIAVAGVVAAAAVWLAFPVQAQEINPYDQSGVPLEVEPKDPKAIKVVVVAGRQSHGPGDHEFFAGSAILCNMLKQTEGVVPVMARDGWPKNEKIFEGAKAVVFYMDGGGGHPVIQKGHKEVVQKLMDQGVGFVNIHYAVEYPKQHSDAVLAWLGGYYETGFSTNPHWVADFKTLADHPIARGVKPFNIRDEWYFNIRFAPESKHVTPILKATPPDGVRGTPAAKEAARRSSPGRLTATTAAAASASPAATPTRTGPTKTSASSSPTPSSGPPRSRSPRTAPRST